MTAYHAASVTRADVPLSAFQPAAPNEEDPGLAAARAKAVEGYETLAIACGVAQSYLEDKAKELLAESAKPAPPECPAVSEVFMSAAECTIDAAEAVEKTTRANQLLAAVYRGTLDERAIADAADRLDITKLVSLEPLAAGHKRAFQAIVGQKCVYTRIGRGLPWTQKKINNFFGYLAEDAQKEGPPLNVWHAIMVGGTCVGVVGIHEAPYDSTITKDSRALTIFVHKDVRRRGVGAQAARLALITWSQYSWAHVAIDVRQNNHSMKLLVRKLQTTQGTVRRKLTPREFVRYWA